MKALRGALCSALILAAGIPGAHAAPQDAPLAPGHAAGVKQATLQGNQWIIILGVAGIIALTAVIISADNGKGVSGPSTTSTNP